MSDIDVTTVYSEDKERMCDFSPSHYIASCYARTADTKEGKARFVKIGFVNSQDAAIQFLEGDLDVAVPFEIWYTDANGERKRLE